MVQKCVPGGMPRHSLHHHQKHTHWVINQVFFYHFSLSMEHLTQQRGRNEINGIHKKWTKGRNRFLSDYKKKQAKSEFTLSIC